MRRRPRARQAQLVKPPGSLGRLEELAIWLAGVTGEARPQVRARVVVAAADHGVAAEGVSAYPPEVTAQMLATFLAGGGAVSVLAREVGADLICVDAGVNADTSHLDVVHTGLKPSANLATEPALSREDVRHAIKVGMKLAASADTDGDHGPGRRRDGDRQHDAGDRARLLADRGEPRRARRPGHGPRRRGRAAQGGRGRSARSRATRPHGPLDALASLGGGEIAVLTGLALGAGRYGLGYVCDGVIATAAAAVAAALAPDLRPRLIAGHRSPEPAHACLLAHLELTPDPRSRHAPRRGERRRRRARDPQARRRRPRRHAHVRRGGGVDGMTFEAVPAEGPRIRTGGDAIELVYSTDAEWLAVPVARLDPAFFDLRSGVAGDLVQKFVNYGQKVAVVGDIAEHVERSDALRDFVRESNRGAQLWFVADADELARRLR